MKEREEVALIGAFNVQIHCKKGKENKIALKS
jgi:hypothetical protein